MQFILNSDDIVKLGTLDLLFLFDDKINYLAISKLAISKFL